MATETVANKYPRAGGLFYACFNSSDDDLLAGYKAVRTMFGANGVRKVKRINETGLLAMFHVPMTPETELHANTIAERLERRLEAEDRWIWGKPKVKDESHSP